MDGVKVEGVRGRVERERGDMKDEGERGDMKVEGEEGGVKVEGEG